MQLSNDSKQPQRLWKNYFIYPRFQFSIVIFNLVILFSAIGFIYYQVNKSFWVMEQFSSKSVRISSVDYNTIIEFHLELVMDAILTAGILCTVFIIIYNVIFTHKSAGAIHRLRGYLKDVIENGYTRDLNFREGDMHDDLPELVNKAIKKVKEDAKKDQ